MIIDGSKTGGHIKTARSPSPQTFVVEKVDLDRSRVRRSSIKGSLRRNRGVDNDSVDGGRHRHSDRLLDLQRHLRFRDSHMDFLRLNSNRLSNNSNGGNDRDWAGDFLDGIKLA